MQLKLGELGTKYPYVLALTTFFSLTIVELRSTLTNCTSRSVGNFGDAYGTMWLNWVMSNQDFPPWKERTTFSGYPQGEFFWTFDWWTSILVRLPLYAFSYFFGPVCGYNLIVLIGFIFSASCAWLLIHYLTKNNFISILAAIMYGFGPFVQSKMTGHTNYMYIGVFPLLIYLLMKLPQSNRRTSILIGIALGSFSFVDGYFFVPTLILVSMLGLYQTVNFIFAKTKDKLYISIYFFVTYAISQTILLVIYFHSKTFKEYKLPNRDWSELSVYSIKAWHLLLPSPENFYYKKFVAEWAEENLGGSNFSETGLFPGYLFLFLAIYYIFISKFRGRRLYPRSKKIDFTHERIRYLFLVFIFFFGVVLASKPFLQFGDISFPTPSGFIFHFAPYWRTISRWGMISTVAIIAIGALGYKMITKSFSPSSFRQRVLASLAVILLALDLGFPFFLNPTSEVVVKPSGPYAWISENTNTESVLLDLVPYSVNNFFLGNVLTSKRKVSNTFREPERSFQKELLFPQRENFACALTRAKVNYVIYHPLSSLKKITFTPEIFSKVFEYKASLVDPLREWNDAEVYSVDRFAVYTYDVDHITGFELFEDNHLDASWYLQKERGDIKFSNLKGLATTNLQLPKIKLETKRYPELVTLLVDGAIIWSGEVDGEVLVSLDNRYSTNHLLTIVRENNRPFYDADNNLVVEFTGNCRI